MSRATSCPARTSCRCSPVTGDSDLPGSIAPFPFAFDIAHDQPASLFKIVKPSKYTRDMNALAASHVGHGDGIPIDLDRAVAGIAELGYNRIDLMTYVTDHHVRPFAGREAIAASDPRLMAPESVYQPCPRDQILNACVRNRIEFSDVFLSYNDFHLPRYIDGYIEASKRWIKREMASMRHSPALAGMMLYDEMYDTGVTGLVEKHAKLFPSIRDGLAEAALKIPPSKIVSNMSRYIARPTAPPAPQNQRDPQALQDFLAYGKFERHGWGDYNTKVADAAREVVSAAKIGTYHRTWMTPGGATGTANGYPPDVFEKLDIVSHVHYADNSTGWVHSSIMANELRFSPRRPVFINIPLSHETYQGNNNGEYQRHMAFAMLEQGVDGISMWGLPHSFDNAPNPGMVYGKETTRRLNSEVLAPFAELLSSAVTEPGYRNVGIVSVLNQHLLSEFKQINVSNQVEELWVACWRLGYPAKIMHEDAFEQSLDGVKVIFVPGIRLDGELPPQVARRLEEAIRAGCRVIVEKGSELNIPGLTRLDDMTLLNFYVRHYFPTWLDDELEKVFAKSQETTDYLAKKLPEWTEPAARGPFKVGPNWRTAGDIHYLVMANFEDPDYSYMIKQVMAKPVKMPLCVPAGRGRAAYDLLAQKPVQLVVQNASQGPGEVQLEVDMTHIEGALVAFLPEPIAKLRVSVETGNGGRALRLTAELVGQSGKPIKGAFPVRIGIVEGEGKPGQARDVFYRVLGGDHAFELPLPAAQSARKLAVEVREQISGQTVSVGVEGPVHGAPSLQFVEVNLPEVPHPAEVRRFLAGTKQAAIVVSDRIPGLGALAKDLAQRLRERGMEADIRDESAVYRFPSVELEVDDQLVVAGEGDGRLDGRRLVAVELLAARPGHGPGGRGIRQVLQEGRDDALHAVEVVGDEAQRVVLPVQPARRDLDAGLRAKARPARGRDRDVAVVDQPFEEVAARLAGHDDDGLVDDRGGLDDLEARCPCAAAKRNRSRSRCRSASRGGSRWSPFTSTATTKPT